MLRGLLAALRPILRDARRNLLRSAIAVLLISLPVAAVVYAATESKSFVYDPTGEGTVASISYEGGSCQQSPTGWEYTCTPTEEPAASVHTTLLAHLPDGLSADLELDGPAYFGIDEATSEMSLRQISSESLERVGFRTADGTLPEVGEIVLPRDFADFLGAEIGEQLHLHIDGLETILTVSGLSRGGSALVTEPTLVDAASFSRAEFPSLTATWLINGSSQVDWTDVQELNAQGFIVDSAMIRNNPPPSDQIAPQFRNDAIDAHSSSLDQAWDPLIWLSLMISVVLSAGTLLLLVITPVFTIASTRQSRTFALMSTQGATPWQIAGSVLGHGLVAGVCGATLGSVVGVAGYAIVHAVTTPGWALVIPFGAIAATWVIAVIGSLMAASVPAFMAARAHPLAAIYGAQGDRMLRWRSWYAWGPALLAASIVLYAVITFFSGTAFHPVMSMTILFLIPLSIVSAALSAPALLWLTATAVQRLPAPVKLAARNGLRQSLRTVPAVAAITALTFLATFWVVGIEASTQRDDTVNGRIFSSNALTVGTRYAVTSTTGLSGAAEVARDYLGPVRHLPLRLVETDAEGTLTVQTVNREEDDSEYCTYDSDLDAMVYRGKSVLEDVEAANQCLSETRSDNDAGFWWVSAYQPVVAGPEIADFFTGLSEEQRSTARDVLSRGGVLTSESEQIVDGQLTLYTYESYSNYFVDDSETEVTPPTTQETAPAAALFPIGTDLMVISPQLADQLELVTRIEGELIEPEQNLSAWSQIEFRRAVTSQMSGVSVAYNVDRSTAWMVATMGGVITTLVALGTVSFVLVLSAAESRRQLGMLNALGAPPGFSRKFGAASGALLVYSATPVALLAGHLLAAAAARRSTIDIAGNVLYTGTLEFISINWPLTIIFLVVAPLLAAAIGYVLAPRSEPVDYRTT